MLYTQSNIHLILKIANGFEFLPVDVNLRRCERYFQTLTNIAGYTGGNNTVIQASIPFNKMRTSPSLSQSAAFRFDDANTANFQSSPGVSSAAASNSGAIGNFGNFTGLGTFRPFGKADTNTLNLSAEL